MSQDRASIHNFAAGPSPLPTPVLQRASEGLLNYNGTGMGVCELSHRGKEFKGIIEGAEADLRTLLAVPDNYTILFTQGGGTTQFSSVLLNLLSYRRLHPKYTSDYKPPTIDYVVTGSWSSKAFVEAQRLSLPPYPSTEPFAIPRIAATGKSSKFTTLPKKGEYDFSEDPAFVYYCENETINGIQFPTDTSSEYAFPFDSVPDHVPIVADYSSSFISRPITNFSRHAIIYAGAQKNLGPSGTTVVIVRNDLLVDTTQASKLGSVPSVPIALEYKTLADNASLYNTPPVFAIYVSALVLSYLLADKGGIKGVEETNRKKAQTLYATLDEAEEKGLVRCVVREKEARSWMNVTFEITEGREKAFLEGAEQRGMRQLKGHRSVGGESITCVV
ncbi:phosphoserine transaminase [Naematelia encephala]|uniref:phosphoserine transaminase n=1 Tax=Naematelia encephala TaxID=71784 RepID=A0A1Y2B6R2_9TREE|nr:phosphoserine transaminase [Naematelia encephala]